MHVFLFQIGQILMTWILVLLVQVYRLLWIQGQCHGMLARRWRTGWTARRVRRGRARLHRVKAGLISPVFSRWLRAAVTAHLTVTVKPSAQQTQDLNNAHILPSPWIQTMKLYLAIAGRQPIVITYFILSKKQGLTLSARGPTSDVRF